MKNRRKQRDTEVAQVLLAGMATRQKEHRRAKAHQNFWLIAVAGFFLLAVADKMGAF